MHEQTQRAKTNSPNRGRQLRQKVIFFLIGLLLGLGLWAGLPPLIYQYSVNQLRNFPPIPTADPANDINDLISPQTGTELLEKRKELLNYIWGDAGFPSEANPDDIESSVQYPGFGNLRDVKEVDRLTIKMDWGINSEAYYFIPKEANGKLFIYHHGHENNLVESKPVIQTLVSHGFAVIALEMPLTGGNNKPAVRIERIGTISLQNHNQLKFLPLQTGSPIQFLLTPVAVVVNYSISLGYSQISMIGISGGGWTTTMAAAIDPRITRSYPVAGSLPIHMRATIGPEWGDYEQTEPGLYRLTTYPELYLMGAYGENRRQIQVLNQFDSCCFSGTRYLAYLGPVQQRLKEIGPGYFDVFLDNSHDEHKISEAALEMVLQDMENTR